MVDAAAMSRSASFDDVASVESSVEGDSLDDSLASSFYGRFERGVKGMQKVFRWPLLVVVFAIITCELILYFTLRLCISVWETVSNLADGKRGKLLNALDNAESYEEWRRNAMALDVACDHDFYKTIDRSPFYDYKTVKSITNKLAAACNTLASGEPSKASMDKLEQLLCRAYNANAAGLGVDNERLYAETFSGTKLALQRYYDVSVEATDKYVAAKNVPLAQKLDFVRKAKASYGRTALCLSSGGSMAYYHFGVAKALLECQLLPTIICGSSGGALVAAIIGCRTDEEVQSILTPDFCTLLTPCCESWKTLINRYLRTGRVFHEKLWRDMLRPLVFKDMTFLEAYQKTGRILNITCTSENKWGAPIILNYITAPNVVIWCAVLASSGIPPLLPAITLLAKNRDGKLEHFMDFGKCWSDGALKNDIPARQLAEQFNVNFLVVSQVNPHIVPFVYECRGSSGRPIMRTGGSSLRGGFFSSAAEAFLKLEMRKWLRMISELDLMPMLFSQDWSVLFLQKHWGNVTIYPSRGWGVFRDIVTCVSDPDRQRMEHYLRQGEQATYPKISMVSNHLVLEQTLNNAEKLLLESQKASS
ncbi:PNPLA domain-containing protein [Plasmodiophora brassicae]